MKRLLVNAGAAVSFILCLAVVALWIRSPVIQDQIELPSPGRTVLSSTRGSFWLQWTIDQAPAVLFHIPPSAGGSLGVIHWASEWLDQASAIHPVGTVFRRHIWIDQWFVAAVLAVLPVLRLWVYLSTRARSARDGICPACGYDLRGTPGSACPECGAKPAQDADALGG